MSQVVHVFNLGFPLPVLKKVGNKRVWGMVEKTAAWAFDISGLYLTDWRMNKNTFILFCQGLAPIQGL